MVAITLPLSVEPASGVFLPLETKALGSTIHFKWGAKIVTSAVAPVASVPSFRRDVGSMGCYLVVFLGLFQLVVARQWWGVGVGGPFLEFFELTSYLQTFYNIIEFFCFNIFFKIFSYWFY